MTDGLTHARDRLRARHRWQTNRLEASPAALRWIALIGLLCVVGSASHSLDAAEVPTAVMDAEQARIATIQKAMPAVVAIFDPAGKGGGSGVLITPDGFAITNFHVVEGMGGPFMKCGLSDGKLYDAVLVGIDPTGDVAIIQMLGRTDFPVAEIGDSDEVRMGDWCYAMGNPFLLATDYQPTVTYGTVAGTHRYQFPAGTFLEYTDCLQVDASINPGNSGGPLFNARGQLIGINGRISVEKRGRVNIGAGYAISINQVINFREHLMSGRVVDHATLGATVTTDSEGHVVIGQILEQSEAYRRGLRSGDELVEFAGRPIRSVNQFKNILGIYPNGWKLPLTYKHEGEQKSVVVRLRTLHRASELNPEQEEQPELPKLPIPIPGLDLLTKPDNPHAQLYEEKSGFANHHFNKVAVERAVESMVPWGSFAKAQGPWSLNFKDQRGAVMQVKLTDTTVAVKIGEAPYIQELSDPFLDKPPGSGGLLIAFDHLRRMLINPQSKFSDFYYVGAEPLDGTGPKVDVLVAMQGTASSRWYFQREPVALVGWDTAIEEDADECEIRFTELADFEGRKLPKKLTIRRAEKLLGEYTLETATLQGAKP
jgi:serine protease Do